MSREFGAYFAGAVLMLLGTVSVRAERRNSDFEFWPALTVKTSAAERLELTTDLVLMCTADCSRIGQTLARAVLDYRLAFHWSLGGGYTYFRADEGQGADFNEHRGIQELNFRASDSRTQPMLSVRGRLEERGAAG